MHDSFSAAFSLSIRALAPDAEDYVPQLVDKLLIQARQFRASDIHLVPGSDRMIMQWRIDGVLHNVAGFDPELSPRIVARLKVLAGLLTYRTDLPQEGRIATAALKSSGTGAETRVTTFPTLYGEKAAVRLFAGTDQYQKLNQLGLPDDIEHSLRLKLQATSGVILLTGPSGSGKTTTVYACLRELCELYGESRSLMTLEDPIEVAVPGVTQSQVRPSAGFDLASGLKSLMRQDPDVITVGEIRDPKTAEGVFQAALTGHLVLTTFHAGGSVDAIARLLDMGIEPYLVRSALQAVVCQRLFRAVCPECAPVESANSVRSEGSSDNLQIHASPEAGCVLCGGTGYQGRFATGEWLDPTGAEFAKALLHSPDTQTLQSVAIHSGMITLRDRAEEAVRNGRTRQEEVFRILGVS